MGRKDKGKDKDYVKEDPFWSCPVCGDVKEDSSWSCPVCGMGGPCVKGDEVTAVAVHRAMWEH